MQIKAAAKPDWLIPCEGLRVQMHPLGTPVMVEARHLFRELATEERKATGLDAVSGSRVQYLMTIAMVAAGGIEWDGLHDEEGTALPQPDLSQVKRLLDGDPFLYDWFDSHYCTPLYLLMAEKKGYRRSLTGTTSKTAPDSAAPVTDDTATPKTPAPTTRTSRRRAKAA